MLLDKSYFIGPLALAQLGKQSVVDNLNDFINRFEPPIMQAALGYDLYQAFLDGLDVGSDEMPEQKWLNLRDGCVFITQSNIKKQFFGFANAQTKRSILANVVYSEILKDQVTNMTGVGVVTSTAENSTTESPTVKIAAAWHDMRMQMGILWELLRANQSVYIEYAFQQINYSYFGSQNSFGI